MNQFNFTQIREIAGKIREMLNRQKLMDTTLNKLIEECNPRNDDFYLALDWLSRENKIFFLVTPEDTYVLPIG